MPDQPFPTTDPTSGSAPQAAPTQPTMDPSLINSAVTEAVAPIANALRDVTQTVQALQQNMDQRLPRPKPAGEEDPIQEFMADPRAFAKKQARETFMETAEAGLVPWMQSVDETSRELFIRDARSDFDSKFGEGNFDKHIKGSLDEMISNAPVASRGRPMFLRAAMEAVMGKQIDTLHELRRQQETKPKPAPIEFLQGGTSRRGGGDDLSVEEKGVIDEWNRGTGMNITHKDYLAARGWGDSVDDWPIKPKST